MNGSDKASQYLQRADLETNSHGSYSPIHPFKIPQIIWSQLFKSKIYLIKLSTYEIPELSTFPVQKKW